MKRGLITDHVFKHATRYLVTITATGNALTLKQGLLGRGFADHDNMLAKLEKASSQVLTADLKQRLYYVFFRRTNKVLYIVLINKYSYTVLLIIDSHFIIFFLTLGFFVD